MAKRPLSGGVYFFKEVWYNTQSSAGVAQLVEHQLPKLGAAGSNPVARSRKGLESPFCFIITTMRYLDVLKKLYYERPHGKVKLSLGLARIEKLLDLLNNPHLNYKKIHITGTNGKGSVTRLIYNSLLESGERVGAFFSPHLYTFRERIEIDGKMISEDEVVEVSERVYPAVEKLDSLGDDWRPSFFETLTAMVFEYFRMKNVDWAVVEVGLGGRLDATNVIVPEVSVIVSVDYDHVGILGNTLSQIAFEKAGIIKNGIPVVVGETKREPLKVIENVARERRADLHVLERDFFYCGTSLKLNENRFTYRGYTILKDLILKLNGRHQIDNASVALRALEVLDKFDEDSIRKAFSNVVHPGRFEVLNYKGRTIVLDGAHNVSGMRKLAISLEDYFPNSDVAAVIGILDDKDRESMVDAVHGLISKAFVTKPKSHRSEKFHEVCEMFRKRKVPCEVLEKPIEAFEKALKEPSDIVLVAGSLYLVGEIRMVIVEGEVLPEWNI